MGCLPCWLDQAAVPYIMYTMAKGILIIVINRVLATVSTYRKLSVINDKHGIFGLTSLCTFKLFVT